MIVANFRIKRNGEWLSDELEKFVQPTLITQFTTGNSNGDNVYLVQRGEEKQILKVFGNEKQFFQETSKHLAVLRIFSSKGERYVAPELHVIGTLSGVFAGITYTRSHCQLMEYIEGTTLHNAIIERCTSRASNSNTNLRANYAFCRRTMSQLLDIVSVMQLNGLRHCDLHTNNIIIRKNNNRLAIIDFGHTAAVCGFVRAHTMAFNQSLSRLRKQCGIPNMTSMTQNLHLALSMNRKMLNTDLLTVIYIAWMILHLLHMPTSPNPISDDKSLEKFMQIANQFDRKNKAQWPALLKKFNDGMLDMLKTRYDLSMIRKA